jgi:hypothetical protein
MARGVKPNWIDACDSEAGRQLERQAFAELIDSMVEIRDLLSIDWPAAPYIAGKAIDRVIAHLGGLPGVLERLRGRS